MATQGTDIADAADKALPMDVVKKWREFGTKLGRAEAAFVATAWDLGCDLMDLRAQTPMGAWTDKLYEVGLEPRTARRWIKLAEHFPEGAPPPDQVPSVKYAMEKIALDKALETGGPIPKIAAPAAKRAGMEILPPDPDVGDEAAQELLAEKTKRREAEETIRQLEDYGAPDPKILEASQRRIDRLQDELGDSRQETATANKQIKALEKKLKTIPARAEISRAEETARKAATESEKLKTRNAALEKQVAQWTALAKMLGGWVPEIYAATARKVVFEETEWPDEMPLSPPNETDALAFADVLIAFLDQNSDEAASALHVVLGDGTERLTTPREIVEAWDGKTAFELRIKQTLKEMSADGFEHKYDYQPSIAPKAKGGKKKPAAKKATAKKPAAKKPAAKKKQPGKK